MVDLEASGLSLDIPRRALKRFVYICAFRCNNDLPQMNFWIVGIVGICLPAE